MWECQDLPKQHGLLPLLDCLPQLDGKGDCWRHPTVRQQDTRPSCWNQQAWKPRLADTALAADSTSYPGHWRRNSFLGLSSGALTLHASVLTYQMRRAYCFIMVCPWSTGSAAWNCQPGQKTTVGKVTGPGKETSCCFTNYTCCSTFWMLVFIPVDQCYPVFGQGSCFLTVGKPVWRLNNCTLKAQACTSRKLLCQAFCHSTKH